MYKLCICSLGCFLVMVVYMVVWSLFSISLFSSEGLVLVYWLVVELVEVEEKVNVECVVWYKEIFGKGEMLCL